MRMSIALPIVAAFAAAAIGLSSPTLVHAKPKKTLASCQAELGSCYSNCNGYPDGEFKRNCKTRCNSGYSGCKWIVDRQERAGGGGVKVGGGKTGGVLTGNTNGGKPNPKAPIFGGSIGTIGGGVVKYNNR